MIKYLILLIIFSVLGWGIDTAYRSMILKKFSSGTHVMFFSPVYAIGGLILVLIYTYLNTHAIIQILVATTVIVLLELSFGIISEKIMKRRYWDYFGSKWNFKGHIDVLHSFYWFLLAALLRMIFPYLLI